MPDKLHTPFQLPDRRMSEMDGAILRSMDRFIGQLIQSTWQDFISTLGIRRDPLDYSGIHRLGADRVEPFLDQPGLFLIFGPLPEVSILHLGASQATIRGPLNSKLIPSQDVGWGWRWDSESNPIPSYVACISMEANWTLVPSIKSLLAHYLAPLQAAYQGHDETPFV